MPAGSAAVAATHAIRHAEAPPQPPQENALSFREDIVAGLEALDDAEPPVAVKGPSGRTYHSTSIFCLRVANEPRRFFIRLVESR